MGKLKYVPFEKVKAAVSIQQVMELTQLPLKRVKDSEYRCECPIHKGGKRTLVVNTSVKDEQGFTGVFACHGNDSKGGDSIALLAHIRGTTKQYAAAIDLCKAYAPHLLDDQEEQERPPAQEPPQETATVPSTIPEEKEGGGLPERGFRKLPYLQAAHPAVTALGIPPEIVEASGIGFSPRGYHRDGVAVPIRDEDGTLLDYISIQKDGSVRLSPKWKT